MKQESIQRARVEVCVQLILRTLLDAKHAAHPRTTRMNTPMKRQLVHFEVVAHRHHFLGYCNTLCCILVAKTHTKQLAVPVISLSNKSGICDTFVRQFVRFFFAKVFARKFSRMNFFKFQVKFHLLDAFKEISRFVIYVKVDGHCEQLQEKGDAFRTHQGKLEVLKQASKSKLLQSVLSTCVQHHDALVFG